MKRQFALGCLVILCACGDQSGLPRARTLSPERADHPYASYSPDGTRIYWWQQEGDRWRLWTSPADMSAPESLSLVSRNYNDLVWSPDGSRFAVGATVNTTFVVAWVMNATGGEPRRVSTGEVVEGPIAWHPDGRRLAYLAVSEGSFNTMAVDVDSGAPRRLLPGETRPHIAIWSPDGSRLAIQMIDQGRNTIWFADSAGGQRRQATTEGFENLVGGPKPWAPDGSAVLYVSRRTGRDDIWVLPADSGAPRQLTNDVRDDNSPFWSPDGRWIAFNANRGLQFDLWVMPAAGGPARRVTDDPETTQLLGWRPGTSEIMYVRRVIRPSLWAWSLADGVERQLTHDSLKVRGWNLSSTGQIAAAFDRSGDVYDFAVFPLAGGEPRIVLRDARSQLPFWTPDGSRIVFSSDRAGSNTDVWVMDSLGAAPRQLTNWPESETVVPVVNAAGTEIYFFSDRQATWSDVWRVPLAGGEPTRITRTGRVLNLCWQPGRPTEVLVETLVEAPVTVALSRLLPNGSLRPLWDRSTAQCGLVAPTTDSVAVPTLGAGHEHLAMLVPLNGGQGRRLLEPNQRPWGWSPDGRQLLFSYTAGSPYDLGILNLADGSTRRITNTPANEEGAEWSADGSTVVFSRHVPDVRITTADLTRLLARPE